MNNPIVLILFYVVIIGGFACIHICFYAETTEKGTEESTADVI